MAVRSRAARLALVLVACSFLVALGSCQRTRPARLRMATTTSVDSSGLLAAILPRFEQTHHITVDVVPVGSGQALALLKRGDADVGLTHDPDAEATALAAGTITDYRKIMFNDFIIVGPRDDPARVTQASDAIDAMKRIATSGATFISRGDSSGTHAREKILWTHAEQRPTQDKLLETGQGMSGTLRIASEKGAYTLTDRATFDTFQSRLQLIMLWQGGPALLNTYAIFVRSGLGPSERDTAAKLADWFADGEGRTMLDGFTPTGRRLFTAWPAGTSRTRPTDLPDAR